MHTYLPVTQGDTRDPSSASTKLEATPDASSRGEYGIQDEPKGESGPKYAEALGGQPDLEGSTTAQGYSGGPSGGISSKNQSSSKSGDDDTNTTSGSGSKDQSSSKSGDDDTNTTSGGHFSGERKDNSSSTHDSGEETYADAIKTGSSGSDDTSYQASKKEDSSASKDDNSSSNNTYSGSVDVDTAPSYVNTVVNPTDAKPKGKNLHEGLEGEAEDSLGRAADESDEKNPGRTGIQDLDKRNAGIAGVSGGGSGDFGTGTTYDSLKDEDA